MFEKGKVYKHKKSLDMHIYIMCPLEHSKYMVKYIDERGFLLTDLSDIITIEESNEQNWKEVKICG